MSADERTLGERVAEHIRQVGDVGVEESELAGIALLREQQAEIDSLRRDLETCKVDAERYRWLRERGTYESWRLNTPLGPMERLERLDAAIDLARARGEGNADE